jgi:molecular chaperone DnaK (HSP70)
MDNNYVIGIDLGTTNCCAAYYKNKAIEILENVEGGKITPSFVFFCKNQLTNVVVGKHGAEMGMRLPENGIYGKYYNVRSIKKNRVTWIVLL